MHAFKFFSKAAVTGLWILVYVVATGYFCGKYYGKYWSDSCIAGCRTNLKSERTVQSNRETKWASDKFCKVKNMFLFTLVVFDVFTGSNLWIIAGAIPTSKRTFVVSCYVAIKVLIMFFTNKNHKQAS